jgi:hypothetical protein
MDDSSGFYRRGADGVILFAPNFVVNSSFELHREHLSDQLADIDGWRWFESEEEALEMFN